MHALDRYLVGDSTIHRLDARVKVVATLAVVVSNVMLPDGAWLALFFSWFGTVAVSRLSGLGLGFATRRSFVALPFALAALSAIVAVPGNPVAEWNLGQLRLVATDAGMVRFCSIALRSWVSVQGAILLSATTRFPDLVNALTWLRMPKLLVAIVSFMYRYLFVLSDEAARLLRARDSRSARPAGGGGGGSVAWRGKVAGHLAGQLFLRSIERSDRVYQAMLARGFTGRVQVLQSPALTSNDVLAILICLLALLSFQVIARLPS